MKGKLTRKEKFRSVCEQVNPCFVEYDALINYIYLEVLNLDHGQIFLSYHPEEYTYMAFEREGYDLWIWNVDWAEFWDGEKWIEVDELGTYKEDNVITYRSSTTMTNNRDIKMFYKKKDPDKRRENKVCRAKTIIEEDYVFPEERED